jgi:hypothetical protein
MKLLTATLKKWVSYWNRLWCQICMGVFLQIVVPFKKQLALSHPNPEISSSQLKSKQLDQFFVNDAHLVGG